MFLALHLFHLVLDLAQVLDCEESWRLLRWGWGCNWLQVLDFSPWWIFTKTHTNYTGLFMFSGSFGVWKRVSSSAVEKKADFPGD